MIYGTGIDLLSIHRMEQAWARHGNKLAQRILSTDEYASFEALEKPHHARWLAKRWAAKEALAKATGLGMRPPVCWPDMTVNHTAAGKPEWQFTGHLAEWIKQHHLIAHLTLSDERDWVIAQAILEKV